MHLRDKEKETDTAWENLVASGKATSAAKPATPATEITPKTTFHEPGRKPSTLNLGPSFQKGTTKPGGKPTAGTPQIGKKKPPVPPQSTNRSWCPARARHDHATASRRERRSRADVNPARFHCNSG